MTLLNIHIPATSRSDHLSHTVSTPATVYRIKKRWDQHHNNTSKPRKWRPRKRSALQIIRVNSFICRHRSITWNDALLELDLEVSPRTLRRHLDRYWRRKWRFSRLCFSDEVTVQNAPNNPDGWIFRRPEENYYRDLVNMQGHIKPSSSIMFWGAVAREKQSCLIAMTRDPTAKRNGYSSWSYRKALTEGLLPFLDNFDQFQQDNARIHIAKPTIDWLLLHGIIPVNWPSHSPDLNPIEHAWRALKAKFLRMHPEFVRLKSNRADRTKLRRWCQEAWAALPQHLILRLTASVRKRLLAVFRARGWYTKY
ncbi:hypothetical protein HZ326_22654 [Fusarium oxysporum f. sp. albedinis]|nr:hypothetical protein HZ326_22654 [Fusarium oxysporum f. sp. albedinis]